MGICRVERFERTSKNVPGGYERVGLEVVGVV